MMFKKPNTVPTPDEFFDIAIKECNLSELKCLGVIINKTFRWNKLWDFVSISQFQEATGLSNRAIIDGLQSLEDRDWIQSAYICPQCSFIVEKDFLKSLGKDWTKAKGRKCQNCNNHEPPNKWYALKIEGEDLIDHLRRVYMTSKKRFNDTAPGGVMKKVHEGHEDSSGGVMKKVHEQETSLQETLIQESSDDPENLSTNLPVENPLPDGDYSNELERYYCQATGKTSLSNQDQMRILALVRDGVPSSVVWEGFTTTLANRDNNSSRIKSFNYFMPAIEELWRARKNAIQKSQRERQKYQQMKQEMKEWQERIGGNK